MAVRQQAKPHLSSGWAVTEVEKLQAASSSLLMKNSEFLSVLKQEVVVSI
jgi:hypothetical protein